MNHNGLYFRASKDFWGEGAVVKLFFGLVLQRRHNQPLLALRCLTEMQPIPTPSPPWQPDGGDKSSLQLTAACTALRLKKTAHLHQGGKPRLWGSKRHIHFSFQPQMSPNWWIQAQGNIYSLVTVDTEVWMMTEWWMKGERWPDASSCSSWIHSESSQLSLSLCLSFAVREEEGV